VSAAADPALQPGPPECGIDDSHELIWRGTTPTDLGIVLERDARDRWTATVTGTRARRASGFRE
jgi:hypothetical protein